MPAPHDSPAPRDPSTTHRTARRPAAALVALSLALAGCSSGGTNATNAASDTPQPTPGPTAPYEGPLTEYLAPVTEALSGEEANRVRNAEIQEDIATCMAEAGFDYIPHVTQWAIHIYVDDYGSRDWVARVGYDLSGGMLEGPERAAWIASTEANAANPRPVNPNDAIYAQLSEGSKAAYDLALHGPLLDEDFEKDESTPWSRADGCSMWATHAKTADANAALQVGYADLLERMWATTYRDLDAHPRIVDLTTEWAHCMADAGHVYTSPTHAWESVYAVIQGTPGPDGDPYMTSPETKAFEIAVALADFDCKESVRWDEVRNSVIDEVEAQFLKDNKAEIDEYIDFVVQGASEGR